MIIRKCFCWIALLLSLFTLSGCAPDSVDAYGHPVQISKYRGKWVVINYWATWCTQCVAQIPELNKLAHYYNDNVVVLGVNVDNLGNDVLQRLSSDYQVKYPFLRDFPIEKWGGKLHSVPVTYILDPKGQLYKTLTGPQKLTNFQAIMNLPNIHYE